MKKIFLLFCVVAFCQNIHGQVSTQVYDSTLAKELGADEYGMKSYIFVLLLPGSNNLEKGPARDSIFRGHLQNIGRLADSGKLIIAGPFEDNPRSFRGIFILNVKTISDAKEMLRTDPAVREKLLNPEYYEWYGSAALGEYLKVQKSITKKNF